MVPVGAFSRCGANQGSPDSPFLVFILYILSIDVNLELARLPHGNAEGCSAQASEGAGKVEIRENPWQQEGSRRFVAPLGERVSTKIEIYPL